MPPCTRGAPAITDFDTSGRDRLALALLTQYRMATTEQMHLIVSPDVRIEQTRRRLLKLRAEGLIDRVTLPQAGRLRVWHPRAYGAQIASGWPELRGRRPPRTATDRTAVRLAVGHALTVTETALQFLQDARRRGDMCQPLDRLPEAHHPLGGGIEVDRATMGPERMAAKLNSYARLLSYVPQPVGRRPTLEARQEEWRHRYPLFPRVLFVLDGTGPAGVEPCLRALRAASEDLAVANLLRTVPVLATPLTDLRRHEPVASVWRPVRDPEQRSGPGMPSRVSGWQKKMECTAPVGFCY
ncbi:replication-relaxation family protein [Streptomyces sp. 1222.5]|uniref:replication-relaxation family protein n=1 Tax=Streptomyces sp. 1222.5 TaxID=1881026 RepID=UPI003EC0AE69